MAEKTKKLTHLRLKNTTSKSETTKESETTAESTKDSAKNDSEATYENQTLTAPDGILKITGFEKGTDYEGKPIFYVFFDLTNNTNEAQNIQMFYLNFADASQNTGATTEKLDYAMTMDSPHQDLLDMLNKDLNPGSTAQCAYVYNFADETKPVTFTFTDSMFSFSGPVATEDFTIQ